MDEVEKSLCWWEASLGQPFHNREVVLALEEGEEAYCMRFEVEKSLCWWGASLGQPLCNDEVVLALEDREKDYWMRLRRACAGGEPASASLSTMEKWSSPWRTERKTIG